KYFGDFQALHDIDLDVEHGEVVVIIGASGSGKSTLCRVINGLEQISAGSVEIDGRPLPVEEKELSELRRTIGMVFQLFHLFPQMSVLENVMFGPVTVNKEPKQAARARARALLSRVGVSNQENKRPLELSGVQQQRVAI